MQKPLPFGVVEEQDYKTEMDMWGTMSKVEDAIHELPDGVVRSLEAKASPRLMQ